ncbi:Alpha-1,3-mannosyl-glycoprotein 4-beta-N-acetylglucosaminyltransferase B [Gryllus bimaculatus]|nr:Alpha-1,3-mannosyl-glycoprotein 4-beta-N-acetylglucosaminyltransferase B [Gryllus bimaculatus]
MRLPWRRTALWTLAFLCAASVMLTRRNWPGELNQRHSPLRPTRLREKTKQLSSGHRMARREVVAWALRTSIATADGVSSAGRTRRKVKNRKVMDGFVAPRNVFFNEPTDYDDTIYEYFEHVLTAGRLGVSMVLGIATTKSRPLVLIKTIKMIIDATTSEDARDTLIVVLVEEDDKEYVTQVSSQFEKLFKLQIKSGLLEVISPPIQFHTKMRKLDTDFRENEEKLRWARMNLVVAYLMMYAHSKGKFYVYLGHGVEAQKGFISIMKTYAVNQINKNVPWFILDFGYSDFVGKLFRCNELSSLFRFLIAYHDRWPAKELLNQFISLQLCGLSQNDYKCSELKEKLHLNYTHSLFYQMNLYK